MQYPLIAAFIVGLFTTLHCVGMCGGIMGALTYSLPASVREQRSLLLLHLAAYNLGRIGSYAAAGALLGGLGATILDVLGDSAHRILQGAAALLMTGIGLYIAGWFPKFALLEKVGVPVWRRLEPLGRRLLPVRNPWQAVLYGAIWGWLPCGMVYSMLIWSSAAGGPFEGALAMAIFGIGTLPAVVGVGILTAWLGRLARLPYARPAAGLTLIAMAVAGFLFADMLHDLGPDFRLQG